MGSALAPPMCDAQNTYNITEDQVSAWIFDSLDTAIITFVMPVIYVLGLLTNCTFLFVVYRVPKMRSDTNIYLCHLTVSDLVYLHMTLIFTFMRFASSPINVHMPFANVAQIATVFFITSVAYYSSTALVTMVSFERYLALCHPIKHLKIRGRRRTYRMIAICWLVGLALAGLVLPRSLYLNIACLIWPDGDVYQDYPSTFTHVATVEWVDYYAQPTTNISWLVALIANIYMYIRIIYSLSKRKSIDGQAEKDLKAIHVRNQVAKMLVVNGMVFFICQTPYPVIDLTNWVYTVLGLDATYFNNQIHTSIRWTFTILETVNTIINPIIYGTMNAQYRAGLVQAFRCGGKTERRSGGTMSSALDTKSSTAGTSSKAKEIAISS